MRFHFVFFIFIIPTLGFSNWEKANTCMVSVEGNQNPISTIVDVGSLKVFPWARREREKFVISPGDHNRCASVKFSNQRGDSCQICLSKSSQLKKQIAIRKTPHLTGIEFVDKNFKCHGKEAKAFKAQDLKGRDEILKQLDAILKNHQSYRNQVHFNDLGQPYERGIAQERAKTLIRYRRCLLNGARGSIVKYEATPFQCLQWLKEHGRSMHHNFEFLETDVFDRQDPKRFEKQFGYMTLDLLQMSCSKPRFHIYKIPIQNYDPDLELVCHSKVGLWQDVPITELQFSYRGRKMNAAQYESSVCVQGEESKAMDSRQ